MIFTMILSIIIIPSHKQGNYLQYNLDNNENITKEKIPKTSNGDLSYSDFSQNASIIRRGFESIFFEVNVSDIQYANETHLEITFTNNSIKEFNMTYAPGTMKNFTYEYRPKGYAPLGFQRVRFLVYDEADDLINTEANYHTNFTIRSTSMVNFNSSEYYRGDEAVADITIDGSENYDWKIAIVNTTDKSQQQILEEFQNDPFQINFSIDERFDKLGSHYYVAVNMTEDSSTWNADYFGFLINNLNPSINNIKFNPTSVFRGQFCAVTLNASDIESTVSEVEMKITDTFGQSLSLAHPYLFNSQGNIFKGNFTIRAGGPKGNYIVEFTARDIDGGETTESTGILVRNNPPEINGYEINDIDTNERISVAYGDDIDFKFDVFDVEGISYITVKLIMQDPISDKEDEYKASVAYEDGTELTIRTEDLTPGTWTVYVSVTDTDGETTDLDNDYNTGPQQITVVPDLLSDILPWVMLVIGSIIGIITGIGIGYHVGRSKYTRPIEEKISPTKKPKKEMRPLKEKEIPTKPKRIKEEIKIEPEKEAPKKPTPKRKIKRKL